MTESLHDMTAAELGIAYGDAPRKGNGSGLLLDPKTPIASARWFVDTRYRINDERVLHHRAGDFYSWTGTHYGDMDDAGIRSAVWQFLENATAITKDGIEPFNPTRHKVTDAIDALKAVAHVDRLQQPPCWLDGHKGPDATEIMPCGNGLLHLPTETLHPPTPKFFGLNALPFDYDADAPRPELWLKFLHEDLWPDDRSSIDTLQELLGYLLTQDTKQQKLFLIVGPKRAGKGTIARVLTALLGRENVAGPTLASLGQNFGLSPLIGRQAAIISDARLGSRADQHAITERLLSISGEDTLTIDRKYREPWTGRLGVRFLIMTNELPRLADSSGALASRFIVLILSNSFYGREDPGLTDKLMTELPGILNWSIEGWKRLRQRGYFVQPASSQESIAELEALGSPIGAFVKDCCEVGPQYAVVIDHIWEEWRSWCRDQGRDQHGTKQTFGRDLHAAVPGITRARPRDGNKRLPQYHGIRISQ